MNPKLDAILDQFRGAWRFRWAAVGVAALIAGCGWAFVFALPDRYEASTVVLVDSRTALKPALQGLAVEQDVNVLLNYVRESLLAGPQLQKVAEDAGVIPATGIDPGTRERVLNNLKRRIDLTVQSSDDTQGQSQDQKTAGGTTYGIVYQDTDRARAYKLVNILLNTLVNETLGGKRENSEHAQEFLEGQVQDYEKRLRASEDRLAAFKSKHLGLMPTEQGGYFSQLEKENLAIEDVRTKLITAESRRVTLEKELHGDAAISAAAGVSFTGPNGVAAPVDTVTQIAEAQQKLDELLLKYTDRHPDVIAMRQTVAELKRRRAAEIESLRKGDAEAAAMSGASANPVFQSIQLALNQADVDIADLKAELAEHDSKAQELRGLLDTAPQIEAEYAQLARDYDVNRAQYTALLSNFEKARLGQRADDAGSVKFEVVQPPTASFLPVWPKRSFLIAFVLALAVGAGGALAYGLDKLRPMVGSASGLLQLSHVPLLGVVGQAFPSRARHAARGQRWRLSFALAALLVAFAVVITLSQAGVRLSIPALSSL
jgi:polysaccharide chain length determinant protein (PEP-CTERM system associated)